MGDSHYSPELRREMVWLSGLVTYEQAEAVFERIGKKTIAKSSIWRESQAFGAWLCGEQPNLPEQSEPVCAEAASPVKGLSMDGGMVNIREEGWKEFKVGAIFAIETRCELDTQTQEQVCRPHAADLDFCATLGKVSIFETLIDQIARQHGIPQRPLALAVADGAEWIWNLVSRLFPNTQQVVDWYHALQHLLPAADAYAQTQGCQRETVRHNWTQALFAGQIDLLIDTLQQAGLDQHSHYFYVHRHRMQYASFRQQGLPIGSGNIESGVKQVKARLTGPGMRWSRPGAAHMLAIRSAVLSHRFDQLWDAAA